VAVGLCVDQLHGDADTAARLAHAALDDVLNAKFLGDLLRIDRLAFVNERRIARDNKQLAEARQLGENVLGDAVGKEFLLGLAAVSSCVESCCWSRDVRMRLGWRNAFIFWAFSTVRSWSCRPKNSAARSRSISA
jgi:hypothetical protein